MDKNQKTVSNLPEISWVLQLVMEGENSWVVNLAFNFLFVAFAVLQLSAIKTPFAIFSLKFKPFPFTF